MSRAYVYMYFRLDGTPCYVGKGTGDRWVLHLKKNTNPHLANLIAQAEALGEELPRAKIWENLGDAEALQYEIDLIACIGRETAGGTLVNLTDGGEGTSGYIASDEFREKRRQYMLKFFEDPLEREKVGKRAKGNKYNAGKTLSPEVCKSIRLGMLGKRNSLGFKHDDKFKANVSEMFLGKPQSPEHIAKRIAPLKGKIRDPSIGRKISAAKTGVPLTEEHRKNIGLSLIGFKHSSEECDRKHQQMLGNQHTLGLRHTEDAKLIMALKKNFRDRENMLAAMAGWPEVTA